VHSTGALLLDPGDAELLDEHLRYAVTPIPAPPPPDGEAAAAGEAPAFAAGGGWSDDEGGYFPGGGEEAEAAPPPAPPADEEEPDPWEPLDYNDAAGLPVRPYRRGRAGRREPPPAAGLGAPAARAQQAARAARRAGALFPEFLYAHEARARARAAAARAAARLARAAPLAGAAPAGAADWLDYGGGGGEEDDVGGFGDGAGWEDDGEPEPMDSEALEAAAAAGLRAPPAPRARAAEEEPPSYEEQVRAHVEACLAAAADAEATSELQQRVAGWRARIEPALAEQEARPAFDIHAVGAEVVGKLEAAAVAGGAPEALCVPFSRLMEGDPSFAVARAFSAMLQLVNSGNVGVVEGGGGGAFGLSLLHAGSAHSALDAYRAPSLLPQAEAAPAAKPGKKAGKGNPRAALGAAAAESA